MITPSPETLLERHSSRPRNRNIANAFFKAGFVDAWGRGYKKIREGFESAGLPMPVIESADGGVRVTFQRNNANGSQTGSYTSSDTTPLGRIIEIIKSNPKVTILQMSEQIGISSRMVSRYLKKLQEDNVIRREGSKSNGSWIILGSYTGSYTGSETGSYTPDVVSDVTCDVISSSSVQLADKQRKICGLIKGNPQMLASEMSPVLSKKQPKKQPKIKVSDFPSAVVEDVYKLLKRNRKAKYIWLADNLGVSKRTIQRAIDDLKKLGYIDSEHSKVNGEWQLLK